MQSFVNLPTCVLPQPLSIEEQYQIPADSVGIWFTQAHSCQRDLIQMTRQAHCALPIHIIASHHDLRPEITSLADIALQEPILSQRVEWLLSLAQRLHVKIVVVGRYGRHYLAHQQQFAALGIRLLAGCDSLEQLAQLHDKAAFTQHCLSQNIAVVPATVVKNADELTHAYQYWAKQGEVCVKPVFGVFAAGFWHLDPNAQPFDVFANSQNFTAHPQQFIDSYCALDKPPAYLVMPLLSGLECSVDVFCSHGVVYAAIVRYKHAGDYQSLHLNDPAIELAKQVVAEFACDGLVNMQARYDEQGNLFILEVNARPSGGIAYTLHSGINLMQVLLDHVFGREQAMNMLSQPAKIVRAVGHSVLI